MQREYNFDMGFRVNGVAIPDPSSFTGASSDLDTLGERDSTGTLRRNKVATKLHTKLEWKAIEWEMLRFIGEQIGQSDRFRFGYIDPIAGQTEITAYCGDRNWSAVLATNKVSDKWLADLSVSIIEI